MAKKKAAKKTGKRKAARRGEPAKRAPVSPTVVQLRFQNEGATMAKKKTGGHKQKTGGRKRNPSNPKHHGRRRRRNPKGPTFVQALGKVLGATAAMFGTGVLVTVGVSKIAPGNPLSEYGIPALTALLGAGVATKAPMIGAGIAAGAAAPFVLPVAARVLGPAIPVANPTTTGAATTGAALRAVAMGGAWRELSQYPRPAGVGAVSMGAVYAD
jgi:hypothetical protein